MDVVVGVAASRVFTGALQQIDLRNQAGRGDANQQHIVVRANQLGAAVRRGGARVYDAVAGVVNEAITPVRASTSTAASRTTPGGKKRKVTRGRFISSFKYQKFRRGRKWRETIALV